MTTTEGPNLAGVPKIGANSATKPHSGRSVPNEAKIAQNRTTAPGFTLDGVISIKPRPKGRPRFTKTGRAYTPKATRDYELAVAWRLRELVSKPLGGILAVDLTFYTRSKADVDNLAKAVLDAANRILYHDDSQIMSLRISKVPSPVEETHIRVEVLEGGPTS